MACACAGAGGNGPIGYRASKCRESNQAAGCQESRNNPSTPTSGTNLPCRRMRSTPTSVMSRRIMRSGWVYVTVAIMAFMTGERDKSSDACVRRCLKQMYFINSMILKELYRQRSLVIIRRLAYCQRCIDQFYSLEFGEAYVRMKQRPDKWRRV
jgi:hypothetical protein